MSAPLPFRSPRPVALVSLPGANWAVQLFGAVDCRPLGSLLFPDTGSVASCARALRSAGWRILYGDGARGVRDRVEERQT